MREYADALLSAQNDAVFENNKFINRYVHEIKNVLHPLFSPAAGIENQINIRPITSSFEESDPTFNLVCTVLVEAIHENCSKFSIKLSQAEWQMLIKQLNVTVNEYLLSVGRSGPYDDLMNGLIESVATFAESERLQRQESSFNTLRSVFPDLDRDPSNQQLKTLNENFGKCGLSLGMILKHQVAFYPRMDCPSGLLQAISSKLSRKEDQFDIEELYSIYLKDIQNDTTAALAKENYRIGEKNYLYQYVDPQEAKSVYLPDTEITNFAPKSQTNDKFQVVAPFSHREIVTQAGMFEELLKNSNVKEIAIPYEQNLHWRSIHIIKPTQPHEKYQITVFDSLSSPENNKKIVKDLAFYLGIDEKKINRNFNFVKPQEGTQKRGYTCGDWMLGYLHCRAQYYAQSYDQQLTKLVSPFIKGSDVLAAGQTPKSIGAQEIMELNLRQYLLASSERMHKMSYDDVNDAQSRETVQSATEMPAIQSQPEAIEPLCDLQSPLDPLYNSHSILEGSGKASGVSSMDQESPDVNLVTCPIDVDAVVPMVDAEKLSREIKQLSLNPHQWTLTAKSMLALKNSPDQVQEYPTKPKRLIRQTIASQRELNLVKSAYDQYKKNKELLAFDSVDPKVCDKSSVELYQDTIRDPEAKAVHQLYQVLKNDLSFFKGLKTRSNQSDSAQLEQLDELLATLLQAEEIEASKNQEVNTTTPSKKA